MGCWSYVLGHFRGQKSSARTEGMAADEGTGSSLDVMNRRPKIWLSAHMTVGEAVAESGRPLLNAAVFFMRKYGLLLWMRREEGDHCFKEKKGDAQWLSTGDEGAHEPQPWAHIRWTLRTPGLHPWFWFKRWHWCCWLGTTRRRSMGYKPVRLPRALWRWAHDFWEERHFLDENVYVCVYA